MDVTVTDDSEIFYSRPMSKKFLSVEFAAGPSGGRAPASQPSRLICLELAFRFLANGFADSEETATEEAEEAEEAEEPE
jgi:hypothetical protein